MKNFLRGFLFGWAVAFCVLLVMAAVPALTDFNTNQFSTTGNKVAVKSGASVTNLIARGNLTVPTIGNNYIVQTDSSGNLLALTVGDGLAFDGATLIANGGSAAPINNFYSTNVFTTNITAQTITVVTNSYTVGKGGSLVITNALTPQQIGASKLVATEANGALTNAEGVFPTRGSVLVKGASGYTAVVPSTAGYVFTDGGVGADPAWAAPAAGGLATSASQYAIVGGAASGALNWTALSNAYVTAKTATPNGAALAAANRYTIFPLPGVYALGASTLTLDTQFIDIVGISTDTGQLVYGAGVVDYGDTVLTGTSAASVNMTVSGGDITIANLAIHNTSGNFAFGSSVNVPSGFLMQNVLLQATGGTGRAMQTGVTYAGTFIDVRAWTPAAFGAGFGGGTGDSVAGATFIRCKAGSISFGDKGAATIIDCEADGLSMGRNAASGTYIRCREVNVDGTAGGLFSGSFTGIAEDCSTTAGLTYSSGTVRNCNFNGTIENRGLTVINSSSGFSSTHTTAAVAIAETGWTNTLAKLVRVFFNGTAMTYTVKDSAGTPYYTNAVALTGADMIVLQASEAVTISGTGVAGVRKPL